AHIASQAGRHRTQRIQIPLEGGARSRKGVDCGAVCLQIDIPPERIGLRLQRAYGAEIGLEADLLRELGQRITDEGDLLRERGLRNGYLLNLCREGGLRVANAGRQVGLCLLQDLSAEPLE